jgi:hypothetical protein
MVNAIQIMQKRNAMGIERGILPDVTLPMAFGFGENFRVSCELGWSLAWVKPWNQSWVPFAMPKYLPSS